MWRRSQTVRIITLFVITNADATQIYRKTSKTLVWKVRTEEFSFYPEASRPDTLASGHHPLHELPSILEASTLTCRPFIDELDSMLIGDDGSMLRS